MCNWKMALNHKQAIDLVKEYKELSLTDLKLTDSSIVIFPSVVSIKEIITEYSPDLKIGAQDCSKTNEYGAYTGETSPQTLSEIGVYAVLCGHSERRGLLGESDAVVNQKVKNILNNNMRAVLCIGEDLETRESGQTNDFLKNQLSRNLHGIDDLSRVIIAYEPIWAIASKDFKRESTKDEIQDVLDFIKNWLDENFASKKVQLLYGGSVNDTNSKEFKSIRNLDGFLIGSASLKPEILKKIIDS